MIGNTIQVVQSPPMQSGIFKSSLFFLSFITLSLHSLLNKRENEVVSVVNTILVVYSRYLFLTTTKSSLYCFSFIFSVVVGCSCSVFQIREVLIFSVFVLWLNLLIRNCVLNCSSFSVYSLFDMPVRAYIYISIQTCKD